ncbi:MAG TPA: hypothetical protein VME20_06190 [Acidimicrobiales bacterium]|nr:hypothetical protein [Acidimicrobiales bacterium]
MPSAPSRFRRSQRVILATATCLVAATGVLEAAGAAHVAVFIVAVGALAALAALVGESIEQIGERLGPGPTGLLQSSLGNLPELLVSIFALRAGLNSVVQAALVGSVLGNVLLVLGLAFLSGAGRHGTQRFDPEAPRMLVTLLILAAGSALVPTLAARLGAASRHAVGISDATAVILLLVYLTSIPFWLWGGPEAADEKRVVGEPGRARPGAGRAKPEPVLARRALANELLWPLGLAIALLAGASAASGAVSEWFVSSLVPATKSLGISSVFTGLVIVAIASNAVENAAGVRFAWKARPDYAISTILNSPLQITLLLMPALVLASPLIGPVHLTLVFPPLLIAALAVALVVVCIVVYDGEYSWLEGVALIALYAVIASAFWWG